MLKIIAKFKEAHNFLKTYFLQASMDDFDQQSTESGALIGSNNDLLIEILLRLPAKSILRFKSVSKQWRSLLNHKHFKLRYESLSIYSGFFVHELFIRLDTENRTTYPIRSNDFCFIPFGIKIVQSCNGLLLCKSDRCNKYYVYNPTTKQISIIPFVPGGESVSQTICFMGLAFHQTHCVQYKVVCIRRLKPFDFQIQIYSSATQTWKTCIESITLHPPIFYKGPIFNKGVYWNDAIHWAPYPDNQHLYFKLDVEQLQTLPLPEKMVCYGKGANYFGESRGHLHLIMIDHPKCNYLSLEVYEMSSDYSGWFVKYQVDVDQLPDALPHVKYSMGYAYDAFDVVRGEKEEDTLLVFILPKKIITYNFYYRIFKVSNFTMDIYAGYTNVHRYIRSLASF